MKTQIASTHLEYLMDMDIDVSANYYLSLDAIENNKTRVSYIKDVIDIRQEDGNKEFDIYLDAINFYRKTVKRLVEQGCKITKQTNRCLTNHDFINRIPLWIIL